LLWRVWDDLIRSGNSCDGLVPSGNSWDGLFPSENLWVVWF